MDIKQIAEETMRKVAEEAVREVIHKHAGYGIDSEIKTEIRAKAKEILQEPNIQDLVRQQIIHWVKHRQ